MQAEHWECTNAEYHDSPGVSNSMMSCFLDNPEKFRAIHIDKTLTEERTPAMEFGEAYHSRLLGGRRLVEIPQEVLTSNGAKRGKAWEQFRAEHIDAILLKSHEMNKLDVMQSALLAHPVAKRFLKEDVNAVFEHSIRWTDADTDMELRCRIDILATQAIPDLKTVASCKPADFAASAVRYGYHRQGAWYQWGVRELIGNLPFVFICQEKDPPFSVECYELDDEFIEMGRQEIRRGLDRLHECHISGKFHTPTHGQITTLGPPRWAQYAKEWETEE